MEYKLEDVIEYWKSIKPEKRTRKRVVVDPRNYLMALMFYKFNVSEMELESIIGIDRSSVNHSKKHPYSLIKIKEAAFMRNTVDVRKRFPYEFPSTEKMEIKEERFNRPYSYRISFDRKLYHKIKAYSRVKECDPRTALRDLIQKALALWEE